MRTDSRIIAGARMPGRARVALLAVGLLVGLPALVVNLPAARVLAWLDPGAIVVHEASGPLRAGRAERVELPDSPALSPLTAVHWDLVLWRLATGVLQADVTGRLADIEAAGRVAVTPARALLVNDLNLHGPVAGYARQAAWPVVLAGDLRAHVDHARFEPGQPAREVRARAVWSDARVLVPLRFTLGEVVLVVEPVAGGQRATLDAEGGQLAMTGTWQHDADGRYRLDARVTLEPDAPRELHDLLVLLGAREEGEGRYRLRMEGRAR